MQARLDGSDGTPHDLGDFRIRKPLIDLEDERRALGVRQAPNGGLHAGFQFTLLQSLAGIVLGGGRLGGAVAFVGWEQKVQGQPSFPALAALSGLLLAAVAWRTRRRR